MAKKAKPEPQLTKYRVFISYATDDRGIVDFLVDSIRAVGAHVLVDRQIISSGASISTNLQNALLECDELLLYYSDFTKEKAWVHLEIGAAWVLGKHITVITHGGTLDPGRDWGMAWLSDLKHVELNNFKEHYLNALKQRLSESGVVQ